ncbi:uncharacterized protein PAC_00247 [Phialocephala subalpina]|uniref:Mid2 domain-containing protein n=1 Tax=Phialocephala subalpina TaxID=576137 RepID=A0A1L7WC68_9HELO|nr:uncharacterized protein PAC_00247 [Phialocephala subalpina]
MTVTLLLVLLFFLHVAKAAACYFPDGSLAAGDTPCNPAASDTDPSFCCGPGWACLNNTVCMATPSAVGWNGYPYSRGSCTDKSWKCDESGGAGMTKCSSVIHDRYCCAGNSGCDCASGNNTVKFPGQYTVETTIGVDATTTSSFIATTTTLIVTPTSSTNSSTETGSQTFSGPTNLRLDIGLGVGVPIVVIGIACLAYLFYRRQQRKKKRAGYNAEANTMATDGKLEGSPYTDTPAELMSGHHAHELDSPHISAMPSPQVSRMGSPQISRIGSRQSSRVAGGEIYEME